MSDEKALTPTNNGDDIKIFDERLLMLYAYPFKELVKENANIIAFFNRLKALEADKNSTYEDRVAVVKQMLKECFESDTTLETSLRQLLVGRELLHILDSRFVEKPARLIADKSPEIDSISDFVTVVNYYIDWIVEAFSIYFAEQRRESAREAEGIKWAQAQRLNENRSIDGSFRCYLIFSGMDATLFSPQHEENKRYFWPAAPHRPYETAFKQFQIKDGSEVTAFKTLKAAKNAAKTYNKENTSTQRVAMVVPTVIDLKLNVDKTVNVTLREETPQDEEEPLKKDKRTLKFDMPLYPHNPEKLYEVSPDNSGFANVFKLTMNLEDAKFIEDAISKLVDNIFGLNTEKILEYR